MKCSNHPDKDVAAICDRCNLLYCGNCALSSNGKCPKCGNTLRSPQSVMSFELYQNDLYKGKGQPRIMEAINSLYMEPERAMKRLKEYSSLFAGVINVTILYLIVTFLRIVLMIAFVVLLAPAGGGINQLMALLDVKVIFAFILTTVFFYGVAIIGWLASSFLYYLPAKFLGGKGEYVQQASLLTYIMLAIFPLSVFSSVLMAIPVLGPFISVVATVMVSLYSLFLIFLSIREISEFRTLKAIASLIISFILIIAISIIAILLLMLLFPVPDIGKLPLPSI
jgi:hypothetical protein